MSVRGLLSDDIPDVIRACDWLFEPPGMVPAGWDEAAAAERLASLAESDVGACFVAVGDVLEGFCTVYLDLVSIRFGQRAWINELAVHPSRRSQGLGKDLFDRARQWAVDHGATHVMVDSGLQRVDAHRFYVREAPDLQAMCFGWIL